MIASLIARDARSARTARGSPWRVIMLGDELGNLIDSNLIGNLNPDPAFDTSWIKPGKTAWDWWSGPYLPPPDKGGTDMPTIKKYIDFASKPGFEYMMIDEGWCLNSGTGGAAPENADITKAKAGHRHAGARGLCREEEGAACGCGCSGRCSTARWTRRSRSTRSGASRASRSTSWTATTSRWSTTYHRLMRKAAGHKLLVDMHGAYPPAGLNRTYPNYLTQEGIMGAEYNKWSRRVTATHNVSLAYTRMLLGPLDYTPGGFRNRTPADVRGGELAAAGADHARPRARHVRGVREPVPDGGGQPGCV